MSRWWKCDLQVATPGAKDFRQPASSNWDLESAAGRATVADEYMAAVKAAGLDAVALADHNSVDWVEDMAAAGLRSGVAVFPGVEITSGTGADGAHVIVIADVGTTAASLDSAMRLACGFDHDNPTHDSSLQPLASPRTLPQILDRLPESYLTVAPHVFNANGLVSERTATGSVRWKALHHSRLGAVDVGDASAHLDPADTSFRSRWTRRALTNFACLPDLAFVSTSDAYRLDALGSRFAWIRMESPSIEGLRQAFLDHEARIVCDWDPRFAGTTQSPNDVAHAWVESLAIDGATSLTEPLSVAFDPRLNVLIGGRGSGKSTVVAALRSLYGDVSTLPRQARTEAEKMVGEVFPDAHCEAVHRLPHSGEAQTAHWRRGTGSQSSRDGGPAHPTDFKVRVISQKELFERAANSENDPHATSRNLLALVDDAIFSAAHGPGSSSEFEATQAELTNDWVRAARHLDAERVAVAAIALVEERVAELQAQVAAFDSQANKERRQRNDALLAQEAAVGQLFTAAGSTLDGARQAAGSALTPPLPRPGVLDSASDEFGLLDVVESVSELVRDAARSIESILRETVGALDELKAGLESTPWRASVDQAFTDAAAYLRELADLGLDPNAYEDVRIQLTEQGSALEDLLARLDQLPAHEATEAAAWSALESHLDARRSRRLEFLAGVQARSGILRFDLGAARDTTAWVSRIRELLGLRADGFLEEVPQLAAWLFEGSDEQVQERFAAWRSACVSGQFESLAGRAGFRAAFRDRLAGVDSLVRARIGAERAGDTVEMLFLREHGRPDVPGDWQPLTKGSPGQRSAAMLSFVLHQGHEPLVLDQPEDDLDTEWITQLVVRQLRVSRWIRQLIVVTHNANIPVNADAERVIVMENTGAGIRVRRTVSGPEAHCGPIENALVRQDIQKILEGGIEAFVRRERRYNNELDTYRAAMQLATRRES